MRDEQHVDGLPYHRCFSKLAPRDGFAPQNPYLVVQGLDRGSDANAIIRYTDRGHIFLMQTQAADSHFFRNALYVSRGIDTSQSSRVAALRCCENHGDIAFTATALRHYHGSEWQRSIVWRRGRYFVIIDTYPVPKAGRYAIDCIWRSPHGGMLEDNVWRIRSGKDDCVIRGVDTGALYLDPIEDRPLGDWTGTAGYMLRQDQSGEKAGGSSVTFRNLLYSTGPGAEQNYDARPMGGQAVLVKGSYQKPNGPSQDELALLGVGPLHAGDLQIDAPLFYLSANEICLAGGGRASLSGAALSTGGPTTAAAVSIAKYLKQKWEEAKAPATPASSPSVAAAEPPAGPQPLWHSQVGCIRPEAIASTSVISNKKFTEGEPGDLIDGQIPMYFNLVTSWPASTALTFDLGRPTGLAEIDFRTMLEDQAAKGVGVELSNDDFHADRREISYTAGPGHSYIAPWWSYGFKLFRGCTIPVNQTARYVRLNLSQPDRAAEILFRRQGTREARPRSVHVADLNGDGKPEIIVATEWNEVCVFSADGKRLWSHQLEGPITHVLCTDLDGNGKEQVIVSTFNASISVFDPDGRLRWRDHYDTTHSQFGSVGMCGRDASARRRLIAAGYVEFAAFDPQGHKLAEPATGGVRMDGMLADGVDLNEDGVKDQIAHGYYNSSLFVLDGKQLLSGASIGVPAGPALGIEVFGRKPGVTRALCVTASGIAMARIISPTIGSAGAVHDLSGLARPSSIMTNSPEMNTDWAYSTGPVNAYAIVRDEHWREPRIALGKRDGFVVLLNGAGKVLKATMMDSDVRSLAAMQNAGSLRLAVATRSAVDILDADLHVCSTVPLRDCGGLSWMESHGRAVLVCATDQGDVFAYTPLTEMGENHR